MKSAPFQIGDKIKDPAIAASIQPKASKEF